MSNPYPGLLCAWSARKEPDAAVRRRAGGTRTVPVVHGVIVTPLDGVSELLVKGVTGKISTVRPPSGATPVGPAK